MRVLIATDAWHPQVNGVVRTLTSLAEAAGKLGVTIEFLSPEGFPVAAAADLSGLAAGAAEPRARSRAASSSASPTRSTSRPKARSAIMVRAYCLQARAAVHHQLHDALSRIHLGARCRSRSRWSYAALRRFHAAAAVTMVSTPSLMTELSAARLQESRHVDARRRHRAVQPGARDRPRPAAADLRQRRAGRGREESRGVPVARPAGHQGRDRRRAAGGRAAAPLSRMRSSSACWRTASLAGASRGRRCLRVSRAGPTRSASCSSKRWPAACRSRPFRSPARRT